LSFQSKLNAPTAVAIVLVVVVIIVVVDVVSAAVEASRVELSRENREFETIEAPTEGEDVADAAISTTNY